MILKSISWVLALSMAFQPMLSAAATEASSELQPAIKQALKQMAKLGTYGQLLDELKRQTPAEEHGFFDSKLRGLAERKTALKLARDPSNSASITISDDQGHQTRFRWIDADAGVFAVNEIEIRAESKSGPEIWQAIESALPQFTSRKDGFEFLVPSAHAEMTLIVVGLAAAGTLYYFLLHKPVKKAWMKRRIRKCEEMKKNHSLTERPKTAKEQKELDRLLKQLAEFEAEHEKKRGNWAKDKKLNELAGQLLACLQEVRSAYLRANPQNATPDPAAGNASPARN